MGWTWTEIFSVQSGLLFNPDQPGPLGALGSGHPRKLNECDEHNVVRKLIIKEYSNAAQLQKSLKINENI